MKRITSTLTGLACAACLCALPARAALDIRVDFGTGATAPSNGTWNSLATNANVADLKNNDGSDSGVSLTVTDDFYGENSAGGWSGRNGSFFGDDDWLMIYAAYDSWYLTTGGSTSGQIVLGGLDNDTAYRIDLVASYDSIFYLGDYQVNGAFADTTQNGSTDNLGDDWNIDEDGYASQNWLVWEGAAPVDSEITIDVDLVQVLASLNTLRVTAVPEPSAYAALFGAGVFAYVLGRRKVTK